MIAPLVRPLEQWALRSSGTFKSDSGEIIDTSYTTVNYFMIGLGALTILHVISIALLVGNNRLSYRMSIAFKV